MTFVRERTEKFDLGRIVSRTLETIQGNLATFYALALITTGVPVALVQMLQVGAVAHTDRTSALSTGIVLLVGLVSFVAKAFCNSFLISGALASLDGRPQTIGDQVRTGLAVVLPVIGIEILSSLAITATLVLLIVPGLIVACMLCVSVPAAVAERTGVIDAMSRSSDLTKGNRWSIFGALALYFVAIIILNAIIALVVGLIFFGGVSKTYLTTEGSPLAYIGVIVMAFVTAGFTVLSAVALAALYAELRLVKEGPKTNALAEVFA
jgi:uncharacterized membrane protein